MSWFNVWRIMQFKTVLGISFVILLGGSIALNFVLFNYARNYYFETKKTRLDPVGLERYSSDAIAPPSPTSTRVVFFGNSRAASWPAPEHPDYEFINRGISSQTTEQVRQRFEAHVRPLRPDVVVIQVGINDLTTIGLFPHQRDEIMANCRANLEEIVTASQALGAVVILTTIFPVGQIPLMRRPFWSDQIIPAVDEMNDFITTLESETVLIFDTVSPLSNSKNRLRHDYERDELHLNSAGYEALNQALINDLAGI